ncbi:unnamed protein product [Polarella glacialis]|uniref:ZZ-type domain-containing protein n=1 Tax=Polarella glacialis TaxID=89957 RepID=A0A813DN86_POLGL|nr:unnamed protein product [Polarella glacialis]
MRAAPTRVGALGASSTSLRSEEPLAPPESPAAARPRPSLAGRPGTVAPRQQQQPQQQQPQQPQQQQPQQQPQQQQQQQPLQQQQPQQPTRAEPGQRSDGIDDATENEPLSEVELESLLGQTKLLLASLTELSQLLQEPATPKQRLGSLLGPLAERSSGLRKGLCRALRVRDPEGAWEPLSVDWRRINLPELLGKRDPLEISFCPLEEAAPLLQRFAEPSAEELLAECPGHEVELLRLGQALGAKFANECFVLKRAFADMQDSLRDMGVAEQEVRELALEHKAQAEQLGKDSVELDELRSRCERAEKQLADPRLADAEPKPSPRDKSIELETGLAKTPTLQGLGPGILADLLEVSRANSRFSPQRSAALVVQTAWRRKASQLRFDSHLVDLVFQELSGTAPRSRLGRGAVRSVRLVGSVVTRLVRKMQRRGLDFAAAFRCADDAYHQFHNDSQSGSSDAGSIVAKVHQPALLGASSALQIPETNGQQPVAFTAGSMPAGQFLAFICHKQGIALPPAEIAALLRLFKLPDRKNRLQETTSLQNNSASLGDVELGEAWLWEMPYVYACQLQAAFSVAQPSLTVNQVSAAALRAVRDALADAKPCQFLWGKLQPTWRRLVVDAQMLQLSEEREGLQAAIAAAAAAPRPGKGKYSGSCKVRPGGGGIAMDAKAAATLVATRRPGATPQVTLHAAARAGEKPTAAGAVRLHRRAGRAAGGQTFKVGADVLGTFIEFSARLPETPPLVHLTSKSTTPWSVRLEELSERGMSLRVTQRDAQGKDWEDNEEDTKEAGKATEGGLRRGWEEPLRLAYVAGSAEGVHVVGPSPKGGRLVQIDFIPRLARVPEFVQVRTFVAAEKAFAESADSAAATGCFTADRGCLLAGLFFCPGCDAFAQRHGPSGHGEWEIRACGLILLKVGGGVAGLLPTVTTLPGGLVELSTEVQGENELVLRAKWLAKAPTTDPVTVVQRPLQDASAKPPESGQALRVARPTARGFVLLLGEQTSLDDVWYEACQALRLPSSAEPVVSAAALQESAPLPAVIGEIQEDEEKQSANLPRLESLALTASPGTLAMRGPSDEEDLSRTGGDAEQVLKRGTNARAQWWLTQRDQQLPATMQPSPAELAGRGAFEDEQLDASLTLPAAPHAPPESPTTPAFKDNGLDASLSLTLRSAPPESLTASAEFKDELLDASQSLPPAPPESPMAPAVAPVALAARSAGSNQIPQLTEIHWPAPLSLPPRAGATRKLRIRWPRAPIFGALPLELAMMLTVSTAWIACWLLLHALVGSALAAAEGGSPGACAGAEACAEEASEDDPVALLQARRWAAAAGADEDWWRRAGRSVAAAPAVVGSMTGEGPAEASHTQAVQTQDPLTPSVGSVAVGGAARKECKKTVRSARGFGAATASASRSGAQHRLPPCFAIGLARIDVLEVVDTFHIDSQELLAQPEQAVKEIKERAIRCTPGRGFIRLLYLDDEGDWCTLNQDTVQDAVEFSRVVQAAGAWRLEVRKLQVRLLLPEPQPQQTHAVCMAVKMEPDMEADRPICDGGLVEGQSLEVHQQGEGQKCSWERRALAQLRELTKSADACRLLPKLAAVGLQIIEQAQQPALYGLIDTLLTFQEQDTEAENLPSVLPQIVSAMAKLPSEIAHSVLQRFRDGARKAISELQSSSSSSSEDVEIHHRIICDGCDVKPLTGARWKSLKKRNYDLCGACFDQAARNKRSWKRIRLDEASAASAPAAVISSPIEELPETIQREEESAPEPPAKRHACQQKETAQKAREVQERQARQVREAAWLLAQKETVWRAREAGEAAEAAWEVQEEEERQAHEAAEATEAARTVQDEKARQHLEAHLKALEAQAAALGEVQDEERRQAREENEAAEAQGFLPAYLKQAGTARDEKARQALKALEDAEAAWEVQEEEDQQVGNTAEADLAAWDAQEEKERRAREEAENSATDRKVQEEEGMHGNRWSWQAREAAEGSWQALAWKKVRQARAAAEEEEERRACEAAARARDDREENKRQAEVDAAAWAAQLHRRQAAWAAQEEAERQNRKAAEVAAAAWEAQEAEERRICEEARKVAEPFLAAWEAQEKEERRAREEVRIAAEVAAAALEAQEGEEHRICEEARKVAQAAAAAWEAQEEEERRARKEARKAAEAAAAALEAQEEEERRAREEARKAAEAAAAAWEAQAEEERRVCEDVRIAAEVAAAALEAQEDEERRICEEALKAVEAAAAWEAQEEEERQAREENRKEAEAQEEEDRQAREQCRKEAEAQEEEDRQAQEQNRKEAEAQEEEDRQACEQCRKEAEAQEEEDRQAQEQCRKEAEAQEEEDRQAQEQCRKEAEAQEEEDRQAQEQCRKEAEAQEEEDRRAREEALKESEAAAAAWEAQEEEDRRSRRSRKEARKAAEVARKAEEEQDRQAAATAAWEAQEEEERRVHEEAFKAVEAAAAAWEAQEKEERQAREDARQAAEAAEAAREAQEREEQQAREEARKVVEAAAAAVEAQEEVERQVREEARIEAEAAAAAREAEEEEERREHEEVRIAAEVAAAALEAQEEEERRICEEARKVAQAAAAAWEAQEEEERRARKEARKAAEAAAAAREAQEQEEERAREEARKEAEAAAAAVEAQEEEERRVREEVLKVAVAAAAAWEAREEEKRQAREETRKAAEAAVAAREAQEEEERQICEEARKEAETAAAALEAQEEEERRVSEEVLKAAVAAEAALEAQEEEERQEEIRKVAEAAAAARQAQEEEDCRAREEIRKVAEAAAAARQAQEEEDCRAREEVRKEVEAAAAASKAQEEEERRVREEVFQAVQAAAAAWEAQEEEERKAREESRKVAEAAAAAWQAQEEEELRAHEDALKEAEAAAAAWEAQEEEERRSRRSRKEARIAAEAALEAEEEEDRQARKEARKAAEEAAAAREAQEEEERRARKAAEVAWEAQEEEDARIEEEWQAREAAEAALQSAETEEEEEQQPSFYAAAIRQLEADALADGLETAVAKDALQNLLGHASHFVREAAAAALQHAQHDVATPVQPVVEATETAEQTSGENGETSDTEESSEEDSDESDASETLVVGKSPMAANLSESEEPVEAAEACHKEDSTDEESDDEGDDVFDEDPAKTDATVGSAGDLDGEETCGQQEKTDDMKSVNDSNDSSNEESTTGDIDAVRVTRRAVGLPYPTSMKPSAIIINGAPLALGPGAGELPEARGDVTAEFATEIAAAGAKQAFRLGRVTVPVGDDTSGLEEVPVCIKIVVLNDGKAPWPETTAVAHVSGENFGFPRMELGALNPGEAAEVIMDLSLASRPEPGTARSTWAIVDSTSRSCMGPVLLFEVLWANKQ